MIVDNPKIFLYICLQLKKQLLFIDLDNFQDQYE